MIYKNFNHLGLYHENNKWFWRGGTKNLSWSVYPAKKKIHIIDTNTSVWIWKKKLLLYDYDAEKNVINIMLSICTKWVDKAQKATWVN